MAVRSEILAVVYEAIDSVNRQLDENHRVEKALATRLAGAGGALDSLALVNFIVAVEHLVEMRFQRTITLTTDAVLATESGPLSTVSSLVDYLQACLGE